MSGVNLAILLGSLCLVDDPPGPRSDDAYRPPCFAFDFGFLQSGLVYTLNRGGEFDKDADNVRLWWGIVFPKEDDGVLGNWTIRQWAPKSQLYYSRWRIAYGHVWSHHGQVAPNGGQSIRFPLEDAPLLDIKKGKDGQDDLLKKHKYAPKEHLINWVADASFDVPAQELAASLLLMRSEEGKPWLSGPPPTLREGAIELDFLPTGARTFDLFVLHRSQITVWHASPGHKFDFAFKKGHTVRAGFQEPFLVHGTSKAPYFVTRSGMAYRLFEPENGPRKMEAIWSDPERPIKTILTDVDAGRTFVLGVDWRGDKDKRFYFELTAKPQPQEIDEEKWPKLDYADPPLRPLLEFARYLDGQKKLKIK